MGVIEAMMDRHQATRREVVTAIVHNPKVYGEYMELAKVHACRATDTEASQQRIAKRRDLDRHQARNLKYASR